MGDKSDEGLALWRLLIHQDPGLLVNKVIAVAPDVVPVVNDEHSLVAESCVHVCEDCKRNTQSARGGMGGRRLAERESAHATTLENQAIGELQCRFPLQEES
jgi:hypothetical protein